MMQHCLIPSLQPSLHIVGLRIVQLLLLETVTLAENLDWSWERCRALRSLEPPLIAKYRAAKAWPLSLRVCDTMAFFLCRNGFWGIFLLAAWPNALFDLCGICCGHFQMPFWEFFGATFCGKALVKVEFHFLACPNNYAAAYLIANKSHTILYNC